MTVYVVIESTGNQHEVDGYFVVGVYDDEGDAHQAARDHADYNDVPVHWVDVHAETVQTSREEKS